MSRSDLIDIEMQQHAATEKAILVSDDGDEANAVWLPVSQIQTRQKAGARMIVNAGVAGHGEGAGLMAIVIRRKVVAPPPEPVVKPVKAAPGRLFDSECRMVMATGPNAAVSWWLMAGYMYYVHDTPIISDALFDEMAKVMQASWNDITHQHKRLITPGHLKTGSLFDLKPADYPLMVRAGATHLVKTAWGLSLEIKH